MINEFIKHANGLYYNWNRWYNPDIGRYMELDKIFLHKIRSNYCGLSYGQAYNYAINFPVMYYDINGRGVFCTGLKQKVEDAIKESKKSIENCKLDIIKYKKKEIIDGLDKDIYCTGSSIGCGDYNGFIITLSRNAFIKEKCGCLASTLIHEASHVAGFNETDSYCIEASCTECSIYRRCEVCSK